MKYYVNIGDEEFEIRLKEEGDQLIATLDGRDYRVDPAVVEEGVNYSVIIDGESFNVSLNSEASQLNLLIGGHLYPTEVLDEREKGAQALNRRGKQDGPRVIQSVMPGIVRKVFVNEGDQVSAGAPLLILEAMKMENEMTAENEGNIVKVHVREGQTVNSSDPLITME